MKATLVSALRRLDMPAETERKSRVHLVWLSKGWAMPAHEPKGSMKLIAFKKDTEPVDEGQEVGEARRLDIDTWTGSELTLDEWGAPRFFVVPMDRSGEVEREGALDELLSLAKALDYWIVKDPWARVYGPRSGPEEDD